MSDNEGGPSNRYACASCKHQRKRCRENCILAPHFPASKGKEFNAVHKVFGIANVTKNIRALNFADQEAAVRSYIWEALLWDQDPVHGPLGYHRRVEERLRLLEEQNHHQENIMQSMAQAHQQPLLQGVPWQGDNIVNFGMVNNIPHEINGARNFVHGNSSVVNVSKGSSLDRMIQERGFHAGGVGPNFVQAGQGGQLRNNNGIYGFPPSYYLQYPPLVQGQERGYEAVRRVAGDGQMRVANLQVGGGVSLAHTSYGAVLPREERVRVGGDDGQYAAAHSLDNVGDHSQQQQQQISTNQNKGN